MFKALGFLHKRPILPLRPCSSRLNRTEFLDKVIPELSVYHGLNSYCSSSRSHQSVEYFATIQGNAYKKRSQYPYLNNNFAMAYSNSAKVKDLEVNVVHEQTAGMPVEDMKFNIQRKEPMLLGVDHDISAVTKELKEAQQELMTNMKKCSRALFAVGSIHALWGGAMFFVLETPIDHAVFTEICMSTLVILGLAYQINQTIKPVSLYTRFEEHRLQGILFLSRQVSRMVGAFFHRGSGIGFVLSLTITAHSLSCLRFFF